MSEKGFMLLYNVNVQTQHPVEIKVNICSLGVVTYFCNGWCCLHRAGQECVCVRLCECVDSPKGDQCDSGGPMHHCQWQAAVYR